MSTARKVLDRAITEDAFMAQVRQLARVRGWADYHVLDSRGSEAGWPDLVMVRPPRILIAELKSATGRLSVTQRQWRTLLEACPGIEYHLWRPADWDQITEALR